MQGRAPDPGMDEVFKALADPTRRGLLDALFAEDGQTLSALEARLPMTRFGVMKHLKALEDAHLITTKKHGREKLHFLNPVPIRLIHDRWVSKYAEGWTAGLVGLKNELEQQMSEQTVTKVFEIFIKTTPERLWEAITDPETRAKYNFGVASYGEWEVGARHQMTAPNAGFVLGESDILEVDPPRKLVHTMDAYFTDAARAEPTSRVTWEIHQIEDSCLLLVTHDQLREGGPDEIYGGWPMILSGLKTWLETGELLTTPGSLMYASG